MRALQALDSDYFDGEATRENSPGVQVLDPDFFRGGKGLLSQAEPGTYGCTTVAGATPKGEASVVGRIVNNFCASDVSTRWVPKAQTYKERDVLKGEAERVEVSGYYQICCRKKGRGSYRRPGVR